MSNILLTEANFKAETASGVCVVDFFAPWCGPCRVLGPVIEELAEEYKDKAKIFKLNIDESDNLATQFQVNTIPTVIFFKDGKEAKRHIGLLSKEEIKKNIDSLQ